MHELTHVLVGDRARDRTEPKKIGTIVGTYKEPHFDGQEYFRIKWDREQAHVGNTSFVRVDSVRGFEIEPLSPLELLADTGT